ncbi:MAG: SIS domain-containing protein [Pelagimonas sp.]|uniref:SIS domain-containing protein n=1 Tax=Pelagimonas sp. TaxID=2073170 RepID=UPI003D6BD46D
MLVKDYIQEQPKLAGRMIDELPAAYAGLLPASPPEAVLLVGTGSSMNALMTALPLFRKTGVPVVLVSPQECLESLDTMPSGKVLSIVVSQSGESIDTLHTTEALLRREGSVIVLTGNPDSPLAQTGAAVAAMPVADEQIGPKTKGYSATALALQIFGHALTRQDIPADTKNALSDMETFALQSERWAVDFAQRAAESDVLVVLGQKEHVGTASEGSLKIAEMSGLPSFGLETEEMSHGRFHGLTEKSLVCFITATDAEYDFACRMKAAIKYFSIGSEILDFRASGKPAEVAGLRWTSRDTNPLLAPIIAALPFQFLAMHTALVKGIDPEKMRYPTMGKFLKIKVGTAA